MERICHRCHAELPGSVRGAASDSNEDLTLFCPHCGAPQVQLPEYMRTEEAPVVDSTTGAVPPPRPQMVEWSLALRCAAPVAVLSGLLAIAGLVAPAASFLNTLLVLGGAGIVLALYRARRPLARVDGSVGLRVGLLTGLAMVVAMGVALSITGVVERFGLHGMTSFDAEVTQQFSAMQVQMVEKMQAQDQGREVQQKVIGYLGSPEVRAGLGIFYLGMLAGFVLLLTTASGAFAGMIQTRRRALPRGE